MSARALPLSHTKPPHPTFKYLLMIIFIMCHSGLVVQLQHKLPHWAITIQFLPENLALAEKHIDSYHKMMNFGPSTYISESKKLKN